jgi:hypothetical protein
MLIYKKESQADIKAQADFILSCTQITSDILTIPNCPWTINANPVAYWVANGQDRLGELQIRIIRFMHQNYFKYGRPVYMKARSIAERMGESIASIKQSIAGLVDRGILVRLHFMLDSNNRAMILPGTRQFRDFIQKEGIIRGCSNYPGKLPKQLQKSNAIYNLLLYFKQRYLNLKVTLQSLKSSIQKKMNCYAVPLSGCDEPATTNGKPSLLNTLKERIKRTPPAGPPAPPSAERLKDLLKKNNFDVTKLSIVDQNELIALVDYRLMVNMREYMRCLRVVTSPSLVNSSKRILTMVCWLFYNDHSLDVSLTDRVMDRWNSMADENPRVISHKKTARGSKSHTIRLIVNTYNKYKRGEDFILRGILRLFEDGWDHKSTYYTTKKISFEDIFINPLGKQVWETMLNASNDDWKIFVRNDGYKIKNYHEEIEKARQMFIHVFFTDHPDKGANFLRLHNRIFASWVTRLINSHKTYKRNTGSLGLVFQTDNAHPSVLFEYFMWYNTNRVFDGLNMNDLTSKDYWGRFINHMRIEWNDHFWKRESEMVEE